MNDYIFGNTDQLYHNYDFQQPTLKHYTNLLFSKTECHLPYSCTQQQNNFNYLYNMCLGDICLHVYTLGSFLQAVIHLYENPSIVVKP